MGLFEPILLMTRALIPVSFIKGQNGEGAGFNLELIVIIAPDNWTLQYQVLYGAVLILALITPYSARQN